ncbi:ATP-binding protein [Belliella marina]|uniref:histidine kinase n=1 Tax=Belliella marina TaxID=1644146 RepID=A0ABW4VJN9_9BACT
MKEKDSRYESIFEILPIPTWEMDFSDLKSYLVDIRIFGCNDDLVKEYFSKNPNNLFECIKKAKILNFNKACLDLYGTDSKEELIEKLSPAFFGEPFDAHLELITEICADKKYFEITSKIRTLKGKAKESQFKWSVVPGYENKLDRVIINTVDISEDESLKYLIKKYHYVTKATFDAVWDLDISNNTVTWGEGYHYIFGYDLKELDSTREKWISLIHPDEQKKISESLSNVIKSNFDSWQEEYRLKKANGEYALVSDRGLIIRDQDNKPLHIVGAMQDISSRRNAENELLTRNQFIETTLENIPIGITVNNIITGEATLVNKTFSEIYGWPEDEIKDLEKFYEKVFPDPEYKKHITSQFYSDILSLDPSRMMWNNVEITTKAGEKRTVTAKSILVPDQNLVISTVIDDTENKRYQAAILKKSKYLESISKIVESLLVYEDWGFVLQESLSELGSVMDVDRAYFLKNHQYPNSGRLFVRHICEWCKEGIIPQIDNPDYQEIPLELHPEFLKAAMEKSPFTATRSQLTGASRKILEDQDIKSILLIPIYFKNTFFGTIGFDDCTTERVWLEDDISFLQTIASNLGVAIEKADFENSLKELNHELKISNKNLAASNSELEQFAYAASHDLQEPLRMITSFLALIEKKYDAILDEKGKSYIHFASDGAKRMRNIILDLLEYSRVGRMGEVENQTFDSKAVLIEVIDLLKTQIQFSKAVIRSQDLPMITTKKTAFSQLLQNLISNAVKYQKPNNKPEIRISCKTQGDDWLFSVEDNGLGIAPEYFEKIFVIFQRLHDRSEYSGSGIGLAICRKIIEYLGGNIWVESEIDKGSIFYFTIPQKNL